MESQDLYFPAPPHPSRQLTRLEGSGGCTAGPSPLSASRWSQLLFPRETRKVCATEAQKAAGSNPPFWQVSASKRPFPSEFVIRAYISIQHLFLAWFVLSLDRSLFPSTFKKVSPIHQTCVVFFFQTKIFFYSPKDISKYHLSNSTKILNEEGRRFIYDPATPMNPTGFCRPHFILAVFATKLLP